MFKAINMKVLLIVSLALFVFCSSVNMLPARSFLESITDNSKRQIGTCPYKKIPCQDDSDCINQETFSCRGKFQVLSHLELRSN